MSWDGTLVCASTDLPRRELEPQAHPGPQPLWGRMPGCVSGLPLSQGSGTQRRRKEREGWWLTLGMLRGPMLQRWAFCQSPGELKCSPQKNEQGGNWADLVCLALTSLGTQMQKGNCSQTAEVRLWFEREDRLARRMRWPAPFSSPLAVSQEVSPSLP